MKTFISFVYDALGFFFAPKHTIDDLSAHYKPSLLSLGFSLSLIAALSVAVASGVAAGWNPSTVFFYVASTYLGQFLFVSIIFALIALFNGPVNAKSFWGLIFASDIVLLLCLPLALLETLLPFRLSLLTSAVGLWSILLKLFVIQKTMRANFAKAFVVSLAPSLLLVLWIITGIVIIAENINGMISAFY